jgi:hypothetical protein
LPEDVNPPLSGMQALGRSKVKGNSDEVEAFVLEQFTDR